MDGEKRTATGVITESAVQATLRRGSTPELAPIEERLMRMRLGAGVPLSARLDRIAVASDAEIELLAYEIEAWLVLKERRASRARTAQPALRTPPAAKRATPSSRTKEKIVRALRKKGQ